MCSLSKELSILSRETIQNGFFSRIMPLSQLRKTLTKCNISIITEDIYLKLRVCVHYPKSNHNYEGRQLNFFCFSFRIMPLFRLTVCILYQVPHSQALAPTCGALVYTCLY